MTQMQRCRAFVSFDYDHDQDLKNLLVGQSRNPASPFIISDWSIKEASRTWRSEARKRIKRTDLVIAICGHHTHKAAGVSTEIEIAKDEGKPYFLLRGRKSGWIRRPRGTSPWWDKIYPWTWESLRNITLN